MTRIKPTPELLRAVDDYQATARAAINAIGTLLMAGDIESAIKMLDGLNNTGIQMVGSFRRVMIEANK